MDIKRSRWNENGTIQQSKMNYLKCLFGFHKFIYHQGGLECVNCRIRKYLGEYQRMHWLVIHQMILKLILLMCLFYLNGYIFAKLLGL